MSALNELSLHELARLKERREFSSMELIEDCIARIETREPQVRAFQHVDFDRIRNALAQPVAVASGTNLAGIPFGVKDIMDTCDMPTAWGSPIYAANRPPRDAGCVASLRARGAVAAGKTVTTEFACFHSGKTRNPQNLEHTPGGSSQGSAAAVADNMLPFALGTQTAASVIRPAAFCGVAGYKASRGEFDLGGVCSLSQSLDSLGFFARDARDFAIIRAAMLGDAPGAALAKPVKIGLNRTPHWRDASAESRALIESTAVKLERLGVVVEEVGIGPMDGALTEAHKQVMAFETARARAFEYHRFADLLSPQMRSLIEEGLAITRQRYTAALALAAQWAAKLDRILADVDCLLAPSAVGEAPRGLDGTGDPLFSRMWTLLGVPCVTLPADRGPADLPLGIQLIGRHRHDDELIARASWVQSIIRS